MPLKQKLKRIRRNIGRRVREVVGTREPVVMDFEYEIIRRPRRKTASISVRPDHSVVITVPGTLSQHRIDQFVQSKTRWIRNRLRFNSEIQGRFKPKQYVSGEVFSYLGRNYRLQVEQGEIRPAGFKLGRLTVHVSPAASEQEKKQQVVEQLTEWYRKHALQRLREKTARFSARLGVTPTNVGIKAYKSRWGSRHVDGRIYYNWRIIMAPHPVVDYLVVHELCHLVHHNHSRTYWMLVESIMPDYREAKKWLKENGASLTIM